MVSIHQGVRCKKYSRPDVMTDCNKVLLLLLVMTEEVAKQHI